MAIGIGTALIILFALSLVWWWRPRQSMSPAAWILLTAYLLFGGVAFWFLWFNVSSKDYRLFEHLKPTILYGTLCLLFFGAPFLGWGFPAKWVVGTRLPLANREWQWLNWMLGGLLGVLGAVNLGLAFTVEEADWIGFKESSYVNLLMIILVRFNFVMLPTFRNAGLALYQFYRKVRP